MEADRMGWLLPALTDARFQTQRDVVLNERRQNYENRPYGLAQFALHAAVYPPDHSYHWPTIGDPEDLLAATADDARAFFARFYHPGNASLAIAGDIRAAEALSMAERLFGEIPPGLPVAPVSPPPPSAGGRRLMLEDRVELPRLYVAWPTPALFAPGDAALDLLGDLLANGRMSRLYGRLVYERRLAVDIGASQGSRELGSLFQVVATAAPGHALAEIESDIYAELARLAADGPTPDELERGHVQAEASFVYRLQTLGGFGGKADQLNSYNVYVGRPDFFDEDLGRYLSVTREDIAAAASGLGPEGATVLNVMPRGKADSAAP
jgi:zinc protease